MEHHVWASFVKQLVAQRRATELMVVNSLEGCRFGYGLEFTVLILASTIELLSLDSD